MVDKRKTWIDICKGMAIILVVIGHSFRDEMLTNSIAYFVKTFIYSFHMPLFMAISGYVFGIYYEKNISDPVLFLKKKCASLLEPFCLYTILLYVIFYAVNKNGSVYSLLSNTGFKSIPISDYFIAVLKGLNPYGVHLWYIYCLFIVTVITFAIVLIISKLKMQKYMGRILITLAVIIWILRFILDPQITIVFRTMYYGMFYVVGIKWDEITCCKYKSKIGYFICSLISWWILILSSIEVFLNQPDWFKMVRIIPICIVIDNIFSLGKKIESVVSLEKRFSFLGRNSFTIYLLHQPFFCAFLGAILIKLGIGYVYICCICTVIGVFVPLIVRKVILLNGITAKVGMQFGIK